MNDVLGEAIWDHYHKLKGGKLWIHNRYGRKEEMPLELYFREAEDMPEMELLALQLCKGKVLDVGAGAGSHSLLLQQKGMDVTALDISPKAIAVAQMRGVQKTAVDDFYNYKSKRYDTLLLLMNGIGLAGSLDGLRLLLQHAKSLLKKGGQIIFDSSDVAYLYKGKPLPTDRYYGEIVYQYEYKKMKTEPFSWLYIDADTLAKIAEEMGWHMTVLLRDDYDQYLARLTLKGV